MFSGVIEFRRSISRLYEFERLLFLCNSSIPFRSYGVGTTQFSDGVYASLRDFYVYV
jgi:hypothetical protein